MDIEDIVDDTSKFDFNADGDAYYGPDEEIDIHDIDWEDQGFTTQAGAHTGDEFVTQYLGQKAIPGESVKISTDGRIIGGYVFTFRNSIHLRVKVDAVDGEHVSQQVGVGLQLLDVLLLDKELLHGEERTRRAAGLELEFAELQDFELQSEFEKLCFIRFHGDQGLTLLYDTALPDNWGFAR